MLSDGQLRCEDLQCKHHSFLLAVSVRIHMCLSPRALVNYFVCYNRTSLVAQIVKNLAAMWETLV